MKNVLLFTVLYCLITLPCQGEDELATLYFNDFGEYGGDEAYDDEILSGWQNYYYRNDMYSWGVNYQNIANASGWRHTSEGEDYNPQYLCSAISYLNIESTLASEGVIEFNYFWEPEVEYSSAQSAACVNNFFPDYGFFYIVSEKPFNDIEEMIDLFRKKRNAISPVDCYCADTHYDWRHKIIDLTMVPYLDQNGVVQSGALGRGDVNFTFFYRVPFITTFNFEVFVDKFEIKLNALDEKYYDNKYFFPHFGYGDNGQARMESTILLTNLSDSETAFVNLDLWDANGDPFFLNLNGEDVSGFYEIKILPFGTAVIESQKAGELATGSVRVSSTAPLDGYITFGGSIGEAAIPICIAGEDFTAPFYQDAETLVGLALLSSYTEETESMVAFLELYTEQNQLVASCEFELEPFKHEVHYLSEFSWNEYVNLSNFKGRIQINSNHPGLSVLMLRQSMGKISTISVQESE